MMVGYGGPDIPTMVGMNSPGSMSSTHYATRFRRMLGETWQGS